MLIALAATKAALAQYQAIPATRVVTIPDDFAAGPFVEIPKNPEEQAKLTALGYETLDEKLAERFHTTVATLKLLNPGGVPAGSPAAPAPASSQSVAADPAAAPVSTFHTGQQIRVPNVGGDAKAGSEKALLPPGPNGPVGVVWIDLTKEHYGIHGTPKPETIGRAESHGCVRLTNWDVARLAQMVSTKTKVHFEA